VFKELDQPVLAIKDSMQDHLHVFHVVQDNNLHQIEIPVLIDQLVTESDNMQELMPLAALLVNNAQLDGQSMFREMDAPDQDSLVDADKDSTTNRTCGLVKTAQSVNGHLIMVPHAKLSHNASVTIKDSTIKIK